MKQTNTAPKPTRASFNKSTHWRPYFDSNNKFGISVSLQTHLQGLFLSQSWLKSFYISKTTTVNSIPLIFPLGKVF